MWEQCDHTSFIITAKPTRDQKDISASGGTEATAAPRTQNRSLSKDLITRLLVTGAESNSIST